MASRKRSKTTDAEASSSSSVPPKWQQRCNLPDIEDKLFKQNWDWSRYNDTTFGAQWDQNQNKPLYRFTNKQTEINLWQYKMSKVSTVDKVCVCERVVNEEEFRQIGITQRFERLGWERALDWCECVTPRVYLKAVTNWYASLRLENEDEHPSQW
ncbi:hypothetical protein HanHA300_Chr17g0648581 [Helianthus annuus]|nr:hypothetical protein HanHA300_Chr17g0648581 [Helianthus annuus]KAJ0432808.1 hypothetical protein HanIR_Chr17g0863271 [Helianthus annuus]